MRIVRKNKNRYLYGLDISLKCTGVAVYDLDEKKFVFIGSFNTEKIYATKDNKGLNLQSVKLNQLQAWMREIIVEYPPIAVSIERMFSRFKMETQAIAKATGCVQVLFWNKPQVMFPPKSVKLAIIRGNASKELVKEEILKRYPDLIMNNEDESDAVAVAITFLIDASLIEWKKPVVATKKKTTKKKETT